MIRTVFTEQERISWLLTCCTTPSHFKKSEKSVLLLHICFEQHEYRIHFIDFDLFSVAFEVVEATVTIATPTPSSSFTFLSFFVGQFFVMYPASQYLKRLLPSFTSCFLLSSFTFRHLRAKCFGFTQLKHFRDYFSADVVVTSASRGRHQNYSAEFYAQRVWKQPHHSCPYSSGSTLRSSHSPMVAHTKMATSVVFPTPYVQRSLIPIPSPISR